MYVLHIYTTGALLTSRNPWRQQCSSWRHLVTRRTLLVAVHRIKKQVDWWLTLIASNGFVPAHCHLNLRGCFYCCSCLLYLHCTI